LRQDNPEVLSIMSNMTNGAMTDTDAMFIANCCWDIMDMVERGLFRYVLNMAPTWNQTYGIFQSPYHEFNTPIFKVTNMYDNMSPGSKHYLAKRVFLS